MSGGKPKRWFIILWGLFLILNACNLQTEPSPEVEIVRKKIVSPPKPQPAPPAVKASESQVLPKVQVSDEKKIEPAAAQKQGDEDASKIDTQAMTKISETVRKKLSTQDIPLYDPAGKIDPFDPLIKSQPESKPVKKEIKKRVPRTPLEKMDFSQMKLVAIIQSPKGDRAMVEEASGKGYIISIGTYMGLNSGKVIEILKDRIIIEEAVENVLGKVVSQKRELKLQKPPGEF